MAKRGRKSVKRATAPRRTTAIPKAKSSTRKAAKLKSRASKAGKSKSANSGKSRPANSRSAIARLQNELRAARDHQSATADILKVIASSPDDVQPVFDAIVANAARLIGGFSASVYRFVDGLIHLAAITSVSADADEALRANFPRPIGDDYFRTAQAGELVGGHRYRRPAD